MRTRTVILSVGFHVAVAATLLGAAGKKALRRPTAVSFVEEKKKPKVAAPKPPPPAPPRVVAHAPERKVASISKALPEPAAKAAPAPVVTALTMSNDDDGPGGIALPTRGPAAKAAAAPTKVASAVTDSRRQRLREAVGDAADAPCAEEPSKPEPVFKQEIEYTAAARAEGIEGRLKLRFTVGADGAVTKVDVLDAVAPELDAAAVAAAKQWRFKPATACGKPIAGGTYVLAKRFELGD